MRTQQMNLMEAENQIKQLRRRTKILTHKCFEITTTSHNGKLALSNIKDEGVANQSSNIFKYSLVLTRLRGSLESQVDPMSSGLKKRMQVICVVHG